MKWTVIYIFEDGFTLYKWLTVQVLRASLVVQLVKNPPAMQETWVWSLGWEEPLEKKKVEIIKNR